MLTTLQALQALRSAGFSCAASEAAFLSALGPGPHAGDAVYGWLSDASPTCPHCDGEGCSHCDGLGITRRAFAASKIFAALSALQN